MAGSNLMFALLAELGPLEWLFAATIIVDNFTTAFSTVAFVAFLTALTGRAFSATQYALLASLGNLGRTTLASFSGALVDGSWQPMPPGGAALPRSGGRAGWLSPGRCGRARYAWFLRGCLCRVLSRRYDRRAAPASGATPHFGKSTSLRLVEDPE